MTNSLYAGQYLLGLLSRSLMKYRPNSILTVDLNVCRAGNGGNTGTETCGTAADEKTCKGLADCTWAIGSSAAGGPTGAGAGSMSASCITVDKCTAASGSKDMCEKVRST